MSKKLDQWDVMVGAIAAMVVAFLVFALGELGLAVVVIAVVIAVVAIPNLTSPAPTRLRTHGEITIVLYETTFEEEAHGILNRWWQMGDGSIMMELLPCDAEGNLENSEPVHVSNATVKGWWYK